MADQPTDQASEAPMGGGPPGGYPSAYGGMTHGPMNPSMATGAPPPKKGGIVNKPKLPGVGKNDIAGNSQLVKQLLGEFLGTMLLVFFGIGSVLTSSDGLKPCYWHDFLEKSQDFKCGARLTSKQIEDYQKAYKERNGKTIKSYSLYYLYDGSANLLHVSFAFGIAVASIAQAIGHVSGAHLNPAVSWGLVAAGECSIIKAAIYTPIQIIGAVVGAGLLKVLTWPVIIGEKTEIQDPNDPRITRVVYGAKETSQYKDQLKASIEKDPKKPLPFDPAKHTVGWSLGCSELGSTDIVSGIGVELFLTFILVLVVCGVCDGLRKDVKGSAPLAIGFTVFLCHVVGIRYTGSSVNPARTIGPAFLVTDDAAPYRLEDLVVYIIGPILGGIFAGITYNIFFRAPEETSNKVAPAN